jgi:hypothetical protein
MSRDVPAGFDIDEIAWTQPAEAGTDVARP